MNAIRIMTLPAFRPSPGMIGTVYGKPAIVSQVIFDAKLADIETECARQAEYAETMVGDWVQSIACIDGRKPAGFDRAKPGLIRDGFGVQS